MILPFLALNAIGIYLLPVLYSNLLLANLLLLTPITVITVATIYGLFFKFNWLYGVAVVVLYIPSIFIFYNSSALMYVILIAVCAFGGCLLGGWLSKFATRKDTLTDKAVAAQKSTPKR